MLKIVIPEMELFDEETSTFMMTKRETLQLEHSLVSLSKWESKWCKPFLGIEEKTDFEILDYIVCMTITQNVDPQTYSRLTKEHYKIIDEYINSKMTATTFNDRQNKSFSREIITSEIIYYWMIAHNIPFECQKWHLNRLLTLIRVCNIKNQQPKKRSKKEMLNERTSLNAARKQKLNTKG